jgi:hypothetical protein
MATDDDRFTLTAEPPTACKRLERAVREEHADRDRRARTEPGFTDLRQRAFLVVSGADLVGVYDSHEGDTLDGVIASISPRWPHDFTVWQGGRLIAAARLAGRRHTVTLYPTP